MSILPKPQEVQYLPTTGVMYQDSIPVVELDWLLPKSLHEIYDILVMVQVCQDGCLIDESVFFASKESRVFATPLS